MFTSFARSVNLITTNSFNWVWTLKSEPLQHCTLRSDRYTTQLIWTESLLAVCCRGGFWESEINVLYCCTFFLSCLRQILTNENGWKKNMVRNLVFHSMYLLQKQGTEWNERNFLSMATVSIFFYLERDFKVLSWCWSHKSYRVIWIGREEQHCTSIEEESWRTTSTRHYL